MLQRKIYVSVAKRKVRLPYLTALRHHERDAGFCLLWRGSPASAYLGNQLLACRAKPTLGKLPSCHEHCAMCCPTSTTPLDCHLKLCMLRSPPTHHLLQHFTNFLMHYTVCLPQILDCLNLPPEYRSLLTTDDHETNLHAGAAGLYGAGQVQGMHACQYGRWAHVRRSMRM